MRSYEIDFLRQDGFRVCLLSVAFAKDRSAIDLAESIIKNSARADTRVVVWREDEVIFESPNLSLH
jgi:hypothetical protein